MSAARPPQRHSLEPDPSAGYEPFYASSRTIGLAPKSRYAKGRERRRAILRSTLEMFSSLGSRVSMSAIARHVGVSPALLEYYFSSREDLLQHVITTWDEDNAERGEGLTHLADWLRGIRHNTQIAGLIHFYMTTVVEAIDPDHPHRSFYADRYRGLTPEIVEEIKNQQASGNVNADADPERIARILLSTIEGLQIRWLHEPDFDMASEFLYTRERFGIRPPELEGGSLEQFLRKTDEVASVTRQHPERLLLVDL